MTPSSWLLAGAWRAQVHQGYRLGRFIVSIVLQLFIQWRFFVDVVGGEVFPPKGSSFLFLNASLFLALVCILFFAFPYCYLLILVFSCFVLVIWNLVNHLYVTNCQFQIKSYKADKNDFQFLNMCQCRHCILYPLQLESPFPNDTKILRLKVGLGPNQMLN